MLDIHPRQTEVNCQSYPSSSFEDLDFILKIQIKSKE